MKKILVVLLILGVVITAVAAVAVSRLRPMLERQLSEALGATVTVEAVRWTPPWGLRLAQMTIQYPGDIAVRMDWVDAAPDWGERAVRYRGAGILQAAGGGTLSDLQIEGRTTQEPVTEARLALASRSLQALAPYLQSAIGTAATAGELTAEIEARTQAEMVEAQVHLEARRLAFPPQAMTVLGVEANRLVQLLQDSEGRIQLEFPVRGRRDQLEVRWEAVVASALQQTLRSAMARQMQQTIVEGLAGLGQPTTPGGPAEKAGIEDQLKAIGKQLKQQLKEAVEPAPPPADASPPQ